jgi:hypothetical protein
MDIAPLASVASRVSVPVGNCREQRTERDITDTGSGSAENTPGYRPSPGGGTNAYSYTTQILPTGIARGINLPILPTKRR